MPYASRSVELERRRIGETIPCRLWTKLFPVAWSTCTEEQRLELLPLIEAFITQNYQIVNRFSYNLFSLNEYQSTQKSPRCGCKHVTHVSSYFSNCIQLLLESFYHCDPVPILSLPVYSYVSQYFNCGYISCLTLGRYVRTSNLPTHSTQLLLFDLYVVVSQPIHP